MSGFVHFSDRPASSQWEPVPIPRIPGMAVWGWFRPERLSSGILISLPADLVAACPTGFPFTLADLLMATGIALDQPYAVSLFGADWQPAALMGHYLSHPIPPVLPGCRAEIAIQLVESSVAGQAAQVPPAAYGLSGELGGDFSSAAEFWFPEDVLADTGTMYHRIEASWKASMQMERQMAGLRQKLASTLASLGKLDRDLRPEERLAADREDRDAWQDVRRWLRELSTKCHREIKAFDIGMTSGAGRRNGMEETYQQVIQPRAACVSLDEHHREFEMYRKDMLNLQRAMSSALQAAAQNGTSRAQRVLGIINRKIRERRLKMREPIAGVNMDRSCRRKT
jgi:hypothetical protein